MVALTELPSATEALKHTQNNRIDIIIPSLNNLDQLYVVFTQLAHQLKKPLMDINLILSSSQVYAHPIYTEYYGPSSDKEKIDVINRGRSLPLHFYSVACLQQPLHSISSLNFPQNIYHHVCVGGTFDHLHAGHKILLTRAAWMTQTRLLCGVLDAPKERLQKKKYYEWMQPISERIHAVHYFLKLIRPEIQIDVVAIQDDYGPSRTDSDLEAIVGTTETQMGCESVNIEREKVGLKPLHIHIIDVISSSAVLAKEDMNTKLSSSWIREWISKNDSK
jgi:pantetheine-phosphate adenylyltransferase